MLKGHIWIRSRVVWSTFSHVCMVRGAINFETLDQTLTYWFSSMLVPLTLSWHACESKSMVSTQTVSIVRTRELPTLPVDDSVCTFLFRTRAGLQNRWNHALIKARNSLRGRARTHGGCSTWWWRLSGCHPLALDCKCATCPPPPRGSASPDWINHSNVVKSFGIIQDRSQISCLSTVV